MRRDDPRHGTRAGWIQHRKEGKQPCRPCKDANAAYQREYRQGSDKWRKPIRARDRALVRLKEAHPDEYRALYEDEKKRGVA